MKMAKFNGQGHVMACSDCLGEITGRRGVDCGNT